MNCHDYTSTVKHMTGGGLTYEQNHEDLPQHPARILLTGPSGCGKSNLLLNFLFGDSDGNKLNYSRVYYYAKDLSEDMAEFAIRTLKTFERDIGEESGVTANIVQYGNNIEDIPKTNDFDPSVQNLLIIDDMVSEKPSAQRCIEDLFIRGRKRNLTIIYLTQAYAQTPPVIRKNTEYFYTFRFTGANEIDNFAKTHAAGIDPVEFKRKYTEKTDIPYGFMLVDKKTTDITKRYR